MKTVTIICEDKGMIECRRQKFVGTSKGTPTGEFVSVTYRMVTIYCFVWRVTLQQSDKLADQNSSFGDFELTNVLF